MRLGAFWKEKLDHPDCALSLSCVSTENLISKIILSFIQPLTTRIIAYQD